MNANKSEQPAECGVDGSERALRFVLRYIGSVSLLALFAVFMPYHWMDATHRALGMGPLPTEPVVGYLARSISLIYGLQGGLLWTLSAQPRRHRPTLQYIGLAFLVFGAIVLGIDHAEGMPPFWARGEGPIVMAFGAVILWLTARLDRTQTR